MDVLFHGIPQSQLEYEFQEFHADATDEDICDDCDEYLDQCTCELWDCVDCKKLEKDCRCNAEQEESCSAAA